MPTPVIDNAKDRRNARIWIDNMLGDMQRHKTLTLNDSQRIRFDAQIDTLLTVRLVLCGQTGETKS